MAVDVILSLPLSPFHIHRYEIKERENYIDSDIDVKDGKEF